MGEKPSLLVQLYAGDDKKSASYKSENLREQSRL